MKKHKRAKTSYDNFHRATLREKIHSNQNYASLLTMETPRITMTDNFTTTASSLRTRPKIKLKLQLDTLNQGSQKYKSRTSRNYPVSLTERYESLRDFKDKTRTIIKEKFFNKYLKDTFQKKIYFKENKIELFDQNVYKDIMTNKLLDSYLKTSKAYKNNLFAEEERNVETLEVLKIKKNNIIMQIERLKKRCARYANLLQDLFPNKFFLLCVKNHTKDVNEFSPSDQMEYIKDRHIIDNARTINVIQIISLNNKKGRKIFTKRISQLLESDFVVENERHDCGSYEIFKDVDDFIKHLDEISFSASQKLIKYNAIQNEIRDLAIIKNKMVKSLSEEEGINEFFKEEIVVCEEKFDELKKKNTDLTNYLDELKSHISDETSDKMLKKKIMELFSLYNKIEKFPKPKNLRKGINDYLRDIERFVNNLLLKIQKDKEKYKEKFNFEKEKNEKKRRIKLAKEYRLREREHTKSVFNHVIEKNLKIIIKRKSVDLRKEILIKKKNKTKKRKTFLNDEEKKDYELKELLNG